jgi:hypothetical protein
MTALWWHASQWLHATASDPTRPWRFFDASMRRCGANAVPRAAEQCVSLWPQHGITMHQASPGTTTMSVHKPNALAAAQENQSAPVPQKRTKKQLELGQQAAALAANPAVTEQNAQLRDATAS